MRKRFYAVVLVAPAIFAGGPACAAGIKITDDYSSAYSAYLSQPIDRPWSLQRPDTQLVERPIGDIIAMKLGIVRGSAQLFRFHLENAPSSATELRGQIDGGGIKLKLNW